MTSEYHNFTRTKDEEDSFDRDPDFGFPIIQTDEATGHHVITLPSAIRDLYAKKLVCVPHTSDTGDNELGLYKPPRWRAAKTKLESYQISPDLSNYFIHRAEEVKINDDNQIKVSDELVGHLDADRNKVSFKHRAGIVSLHEMSWCCNRKYCTKCIGKNCRELYCPTHTAREKHKKRDQLWRDPSPQWKFLREQRLLRDFKKANFSSRGDQPSYEHKSRQ
jgi:hypothetical protein